MHPGQSDSQRTNSRDAQAVWKCEFCGRFYSERTAKDHGRCVQEYDRRCCEDAGSLDV